MRVYMSVMSAMRRRCMMEISIEAIKEMNISDIIKMEETIQNGNREENGRT